MGPQNFHYAHIFFKMGGLSPIFCFLDENFLRRGKFFDNFPTSQNLRWVTTPLVVEMIEFCTRL